MVGLRNDVGGTSGTRRETGTGDGVSDPYTSTVWRTTHLWKTFPPENMKKPEAVPSMAPLQCLSAFQGYRKFGFLENEIELWVRDGCGNRQGSVALELHRVEL